MNDQAEALDRVTERLNAIESRIDALERRLDALAGNAGALDGHLGALERPRVDHQAHPAPKPEMLPAPSATSSANPVQAGSIFAVLGKAMLGIAGAYLLRAVAETGALPQLAVAWAGIVYAFVWLVWAARSRTASQLTSTIYACTSALILAPMLWELTLRFRLLPVGIAAAALGAFALTALAFGSKRNREPVIRVGIITAAALSLALAIASHDTLPFVVALLVLAALVEFVPWGRRLPEVRSLVALAADAAVWTLVFIYFSPQSGRADYSQLGRTALLVPGLALFFIFAISVTLQTIVRRRQIAIFTTVQTIIVFLLAAVSLADFGPPSSSVIVGICCLILSVVSDLAVFLVFARQSETRNFRVFSAWSTALLMSGCLLCFATIWTAVCLGVSAMAATWAGRLKRWPSFEFYGGMFLLAAAAGSGLLRFVWNALVARPAGSPIVTAGLVIVFAILCYATLRPSSGDSWRRQVLYLAFAALALGSVAALIIQLLVSLTALAAVPGAHHLAFIRTLTLCSASLALVFSGARWRRLELTRLGYATLVLVAVKLVAEDLRHGHLAYIAGSIFLFAVTLIVAPRVARARQKT